MDNKELKEILWVVKDLQQAGTIKEWVERIEPIKPYEIKDLYIFGNDFQNDENHVNYMLGVKLKEYEKTLKEIKYYASAIEDQRAYYEGVIREQKARGIESINPVISIWLEDSKKGIDKNGECGTMVL